ncbi:uncharacterized protein BCR38DRAFT_225349 [Pseudomassariella vexata]|uniref:Uncharacterized protein n=1 Tax=Pseudomassariella vexata TaxID=1141098 RepID=A0A1Y2DVH4_9PEZI|nr:uncharacterized protein BCR38DRAFT_225349 [Pseudomassariella vexata]ORY63248.1 hypothetical protein BCR38DRAFT_225349 [Pseudomassariella vexata]
MEGRSFMRQPQLQDLPLGNARGGQGFSCVRAGVGVTSLRTSCVLCTFTSSFQSRVRVPPRLPRFGLITHGPHNSAASLGWINDPKKLLLIMAWFRRRFRPVLQIPCSFLHDGASRPAWTQKDLTGVVDTFSAASTKGLIRRTRALIFLLRASTSLRPTLFQSKAHISMKHSGKMSLNEYTNTHHDIYKYI